MSLKKIKDYIDGHKSEHFPPKHEHWEFNSECSHCDNVNRIKVPVGEMTAFVTCSHCKADYTHIVREHETIQDGE